MSLEWKRTGWCWRCGGEVTLVEDSDGMSRAVHLDSPCPFLVADDAASREDRIYEDAGRLLDGLLADHSWLNRRGFVAAFWDAHAAGRSATTDGDLAKMNRAK